MNLPVRPSRPVLNKELVSCSRIAVTAVMILCIFVAVTGTVSQPLKVMRNPRIDSLLNILPLTSRGERVLVLNQLACEYHLYQPSVSISYAQEALDLAVESSDLGTRSQTERVYGTSLLAQNRHREAMEWMFRSLETATAIGDKAGIAGAYNGLGLIYARIRFWEKAIEHFERARQYSEETDNYSIRAMIRSNAGEAFMHLGEDQKAMDYLLTADSIMQLTKSSRWLAENYNRLSEQHLKLNQPAMALPYSERASASARTNGQYMFYMKSLCLQSESHMRLGNIEKAEQSALEAAAMAKDRSNLVLKEKSHRLLAAIYIQNNDFPNIIRYQSLLLNLVDSLHQQEDHNLLDQLGYAEELLTQNQLNRELRNEMERQEALNAENRSLIRQQRKLVSTITLSLLLTAALAFVLFRLRQHERESNKVLLLRNQELARKKQELTSTLQMVETLNGQFEAQNKALDHVAIVSITDPEGNIVRVNKAFETVSGYTSEELIGNRHNLLRSSYHSKTFFDQLWKTVSEGKTWRGEICNRNKKGKLFWCDTAITPIFNDNDTTKQYLSVQFEITERKHYEKMLKEQAAELMTLNKLKDKLFSLVSHDFRSPLRSLKGILSLYQDGTIDNREMRNLTASLLLKLDSTSNMLDNLLQWARSQMQGLKMQSQQIEVKPILAETLELLKTNLEKKEIRITTAVEPAVTVFADSEMLRLVLRNLIGNAVKFSRQGSEIEVNIETNGRNVLFSVRDHGIGIAEEAQKKLFSLEVFSSPGTANETGIGIGLVLCKDFVERNHGRIWVESMEFKGSTFYFTLPAAPYSLPHSAANNTL